MTYTTRDFTYNSQKFVRWVRQLPNKLMLKYSTGSALAGHVTPTVVSFRYRLYFYSHTMKHTSERTSRIRSEGGCDERRGGGDGFNDEQAFEKTFSRLLGAGLPFFSTVEQT